MNITTGRACAAGACVLLMSAHVDAVVIESQFTGGSLVANGSASTPASPFDFQRVAGTVTTYMGSGGGSTSSGLGGSVAAASATFSALITRGDSITTVHLGGTATATKPGANTDAFANISVRTETLDFNSDPLVLRTFETLKYTVTNTSGPTGAIVGFTALTGAFQAGGTMAPGTYAIDVNLFANVSGSQSSNSATMNWTLTLQRSCRADFNGVGGVTVQDIFDFLSAWFLGCSGQAGAPCNGRNANFNGVGGVTAQDIFDFLSAWFAGC